MPKYSVKKPFTILVAVILVLVLGFVSLTGIQTDLLPAMNLPYLLVMTTYPGASPEQVEADVTQPLENALSVLNGVKNVTSQSNENYSLIFLEYQDDTDMDSAMVKASTAVNQLGDALPDMASTPTLMEISPDMMATQYVAVDYDGMDIYELSDYVSENVLPQLERVDGVASVSTTGLVEKSVQITLDQDKIDAVNDKLLVKVSDRLADAKKELDDNKKKINDGLKELDDAQAQLDAGKSELNTQKADVTTQLRDAITELDKQIPELEKKIADLKTDIDDANRKLEDAKNADTTLPEVTLPIDDALFASCKQILAAWDPQYNANELPANLAEAKGSTAKMGAMVNAIERATQNINSTAAAENLLESGMDVAQSAAYLDAQYTALTGRIQALDAEIAGLEDDKAAAEGDEAQQQAIQAQIDAKRAEQAGYQKILDDNAPRRARLTELNGCLTTLSTTSTALNNATVLLQARQQAAKPGDWYFVKMDITKFFFRIPTEVQLRELGRPLDDADMMWFFERAIRCDGRPLGLPLHCTDVTTAERIAGRGMQVGSLVSQMTANVVMTPADHYIKRELGAPYYARYMDDMGAIIEGKAAAWELVEEVDNYLQTNLGLNLNQKTAVIPIGNPVEFVGRKISPVKIELRRQTTLGMKKHLRYVQDAYAAGEIDLDYALSVITSYRGLFKDVTSDAFLEKMLDEFVLSRPALEA